MKTTKEKDVQHQPVIGLPNALLYSRYGNLWKCFFTVLGVKVIVSEPTNKEILHLGTEKTIDESCLSAKIFSGHVQSLIGACDYILIPRISNWGRLRNMCTRFEALYDLTCSTFRSTGQKFLSYNIDVSKKITEEKAFLSMGQELGFPQKAVKEAYKKAKKEDDLLWKFKLKSQERLYQSDGLKISLAGHSYLLEDAYFGRPISNYLTELGAIPIRADITDRNEALKHSLKISPTLKWELNREIVGSIQIHRDKVDGIILVSAFPCGPDSMVNEIISRNFQELPVLTLILDAQNGTAGIETRLESFVDILKFKKGIL
ncbi:MAG: acyl-CoA dehydratase activase-related protein [Dorea sp.]|nr:acyl-CoA dehydratase activase-related protein [Dorea sp.]